MKSIYLTNEEKDKLFKKIIETFKKEVDNYSFNVTDKSISFKADMSEVAKEKICIVYSQSAYIKMKALVNHFDTEVGWYGLINRIDDKTYYIYDVKVCKQYVDGVKVDTEDDDTLEFFANLTDDEAEHMHFQAHSHVNMSTNASSVDLQNQQDVIKNIGKTGFYMFQIWNKKGEISTYLYDLDNNTFYDSKDCTVEIEEIPEFIDSVKDLVCKKVVYPYQWNNFNNNYNKKKEEKNQESSYMQYYYGYGGYDY